MNITINAGKMREKLTIEKRNIEIIKGIKKETWNFYYFCHAELLDLYGAEKYSAFSVKLENSIKFRCRYSELLKKLIGNTKDHRVTWNEEPYNLIFVDGMKGSKTEIILQANKVS